MRHYVSLIHKAKNNPSEGYTEEHHIIPKCLGGDNSDENLVKLTGREHYIAHQLLVKIYPNEPKLVYAANMMCLEANGKRLGNRKYEWIRTKMSKVHSNTMKGRTKENNTGMASMSEKLLGRRKGTDQGLASMSKKLSGRTKEEFTYLAEHSEKMKIQMTGSGNPMYGKNKDNDPEVKRRGEEHSKKMKGRTKENNKSVQSTSEKLSGRTKENYEYLQQMGEKAKVRYQLYPEKRSHFSQKTNILPLDLRKDLVSRRNNGEKVKILHEYILSLGYKMAYSSIAGLLKREIIE